MDSLDPSQLRECLDEAKARLTCLAAEKMSNDVVESATQAAHDQDWKEVTQELDNAEKHINQSVNIDIEEIVKFADKLTEMHKELLLMLGSRHGMEKAQAEINTDEPFMQQTATMAAIIAETVYSYTAATVAEGILVGWMAHEIAVEKAQFNAIVSRESQ